MSVLERLRHLMLALVAIAALGAFAAACDDDGDGEPAGSPGAETPSGDIREGGSITVQATEPESLDPHFSDFSLDITIEQMFSRGLYDLLPGGELRPAYAEDLPEVSDDGDVFTIKIKDGMTWANGETLDANDFVFGIQRTCNPDIAGHYSYILTEDGLNIAGCGDYAAATEATAEEKETLRQAVGVRAVDDMTLEITLADPKPTFPSVLALWPTYPAPDEALGAVDAEWPAPPDTPCSGPFCVTEWQIGDHLTLEKNENYGLEPKAHLDSITLRIIDDFSVALRAYEAGELHMTRVGTTDLPRVRDRDDYLPQPLPITIGIEYLMTDPALSDFNVRLALSRAVDRELMNEVVFEGAHIPTTNWVPAEEPGANEEGAFENDIGFDPDAAKQALADAGFPDGQGFPGLTVIMRDDATEQALGAFLQEQYRNILGIQLNVETVDSQSRQQRFNDSNFQIVIGGWGHDYPDAENWLLGLYETDASINKQKCSDERIDEALNDAKFEQDKERRFELLREAERVVVTTLCGIAPLYHRGNHYMISPDLLGVDPTLEDHYLPQFPENWGLAQ